jgi:HSP20 family molecular chaperone IbpA
MTEETTMSNETTHAVQRAESAEVAEQMEQTRTGPVFTPTVDIFEEGDTITVLADMPGVNPDGLDIDLRENVLTLTGRSEAPEAENEVDVIREYEPGTYYRRFTLSDAIDQEKIEAKLAEGVLRLELPKSEQKRPRQIPVKAG